MVVDKQLACSKKWWGRAQAEPDPFDQFFSLWIAMAVAAQRYVTFNGGLDVDATDGERVKFYFGSKHAAVMEAVRRHDDAMRSLAMRRGSRYRNAIVDTGNPHLQRSFKSLSDHYGKGPELSSADLAIFMAELVNKIRNNLFHGAKVYDDREDLELLRLVSPLLSEILACAEGFRA